MDEVLLGWWMSTSCWGFHARVAAWVSLSVIIACSLCAICVIKGHRSLWNALLLLLSGKYAPAPLTLIRKCAYVCVCVLRLFIAWAIAFIYSREGNIFREVKIRRGSVSMNICLVDMNLMFPNVSFCVGQRNKFFSLHNSSCRIDVHLILQRARLMGGTDMAQHFQKHHVSWPF